MGSKTTQETKMPQFQEDFIRNNILPLGEQVAGREFTPYTGQLAPEMNQYTLDAGSMYGKIGDMANMTPADYAAMTQANMNPYNTQVMEASLAQMGRQQQQALTGLESQIAGSGAFGSRGEVARGEFAAGNLASQNQLIAEMMQQGYSQAQAQTMAQLGMQQGALGAGASGLMNVGGVQTAFDTQEIAAAYDQFLREQNFPLEGLNALLAAGSGVPAGLGTTTTYDPYGGLTAIGKVLQGAGAAGTGYRAMYPAAD